MVFQIHSAFLLNLFIETCKMSGENTLNQPVGFFKRLIVIVYDIFLLAAVVFIAEIIPLALNQGEAIGEQNGFIIHYILHPLYLLSVCFTFLAWFWMHGGQTLGMKTWRVQLISMDGTQIDWKKSAIRFIGAIISWLVFGLGFFWSLFDKDKRTWHDMLSGTKLIQLPKK